ncbi:MAG: Rpn family recombination-promoting nuclease/putative transposase, partial [Chitinophagaceae bacterium]|nr:Rpn family recombination-promoting nuclease/putative transposase [Chitinophagaceae bacterium]
MVFVDITNDVAFRKIFGCEQSPEILLSFLNAVLGIPEGRKIIHIDFKNPYQLPQLHKKKQSILDVKVVDENKKNYIVEMQVEEPDGFENRVQYYTNKDFVSQIKAGEQYVLLNPVIFIGVIKFNFFSNPHYLTRHILLDTKTHDHELKGTEYNFVELLKFDKEEEECLTVTEQWAFFLKNSNTLRDIPKNVTDNGLLLAYQMAYKFKWTEKELDEYDYASMREQDERGKISRVANKLAVAEQLAKEEKQRAEQAETRAEQEKQRAEQEKQRAEQ